MKVLITGGYGFIGSHLADRLHKEGAKVFIIDNLSTGKTANVDFKHKAYLLDTSDVECENVFRSEKFDAVIHLAAQVSVQNSIDDPRNDAESNIVGLVNMLTLARKYHVKKFIFASSAAVYGENSELPLKEEHGGNPISPYGMSKWLGEYYCGKWTELYGLETACLRFSNVYGPRQSTVGDGSVIINFLENAMAGKKLQVYGDGLQTRDFMYVKDLTDAIYRALCTGSFTGVFNLSSQTETSISEVVTILKSLHEGIDVHFTEAREGDIRNSCLANSKLKRELDWSPIYDIQQGLALTYAAAGNRTIDNKVGKVISQQTNGTGWKRLIPYIENIAIFILLNIIFFSSIDRAGEFLTIGAILYIVIMGVIYGKRQSILAAGLSILALGIWKIAGGSDFITLLYDSNFFLKAVIFLFVGLAVGYAVQRKIRKIVDQDKSIKELESSYLNLRNVFDDVRDVKDELQVRIKKSQNSFGIVHSLTKQLDGSEPEKVFQSTVSVIKSVMDAKSVSLYRFNESLSYLRLTAQIGQLEEPSVKSIQSNEHVFIRDIIEGSPLYINRNLIEGEPVMAAPLRFNGHLFAVLVINDMEAKSFSLYHENLFKVVVEMTESALSRAYTLTELQSKTRFVGDSKILQRDAFQQILESKQQAQEIGQLPYLLLECKAEQGTPHDMAGIISPLLRDHDYLYLQENGSLLVLLSNSSEKDGEQVIKRLLQSRISASISRNEEMSWS